MSDPVEALFVGELDGFVKRRDELVRRLKKDGDKETAAAVKALRKPSTVAWAVNQVARREPDAIDALVRAARAVHDAQADAVRGRDAGALRRTTEEWRAQINALAGEVASALGPQYRDDAAGTFEAASTSDEWSPVLRAGRLVAALSPGGFGLQDMPDPVLTRRAEDGEPAAAFVAAPAPRDEEAIAAAKARVEKATHSLRRAEQRLDQARAAVEEAAAAYDQAQRALTELDS